MQFSVGVEYSLHCLLYLVDVSDNRTIGIKDLAAYQGVSESYLSKFFAKLKKEGIVESIPGAKGGYRLAKLPEEISFWDVVRAIEGPESFFKCCEVRQNAIILDTENLPDSCTKYPCLIHSVMLEAEGKMKEYLTGKSLKWLSEEVEVKVGQDQMEATKAWFDRNL